MTHQEALDTCAADGASLPKLLSADDALAVKHYVNKNNFPNVHTSLLKLNTTIQCQDNTCNGLVEWPNALVGEIDKKFMVLPREVLMSVMRVHQKYFALENRNKQIQPYFIVISNMPKNTQGSRAKSRNSYEEFGRYCSL